MNHQPITNDHDSSSAAAGTGRALLRERTASRLLSKCLVVAGITLGVILVCGLTLRTSVSMISEQMPAAGRSSAEEASRSRASKLNERVLNNERIRAEARQADRELLQSRRDQLWREDSVPRTDKNDAYHHWYQEVREIEEQLVEAEAIQASLSPEEAKFGPLSENSVLSHRKKRLAELRADAPQL